MTTLPTTSPLEARFRSALLSVLFAQWRAFGVPLHSELPDADGEVIDPEALIWCSLEFFDHEPRLAESVATWVAGNRSRIIGQRITNFGRAAPDDPRRAKWSELAARRGRVGRSGLPERWPGRKSIGRQRRDASTLLLRTRDVLGNDCRSFLIVYFLGSERGVRLRDVTAATGYSYRSVSEAARAWERAEVARIEHGHAVLARPTLWRDLFDCQRTAVVTVDWRSAFQSSIDLLRTLAKAREYGIAPDHPLVESAIRTACDSLGHASHGHDWSRTPTLGFLREALKG